MVNQDLELGQRWTLNMGLNVSMAVLSILGHLLILTSLMSRRSGSPYELKRAAKEGVEKHTEAEVWS